MSYQALYRAWRPETFSQMVGQDAIVRTLRRQVVSGRIAHAYLFCGARGTGKTTAAKVLSRAINCLNPRDGDPCGECEVCRALLNETLMDVVEMDAASNRRIDEMRELLEKVKFPPAVTRYKVYIVDEVHMLTKEAFNALLKTLEEPPEHAVFILATTEPQQLPATILSRCQRFDFHLISVETIISRLKIVLDGIGRTASDEALNEIARAAEGAMRDALSLMDVCLSYTDGEVSGQLARDVLGTAGRGAMFDFVDALIDSDAGAALSQIDAMTRQGSDPQVLIRDAAAHLRGVMLATAVKEDLAEILEVTPEDAERFSRQAGRTSAEAVNRMLELFVRAEPDTRWASRPRTVLELTAVRACRPEREPDAQLTERLSRVEKLIEKGIPAAPVKPAAKPKAQSPAKLAPPPTPATPADAPPETWLVAVSRLTEENPSLRKFLDAMRFIRIEGDVITVEFAKKDFMAYGVLRQKEKQAMIDQTMTEAFGREVKVNMVQEGDAQKKLNNTVRNVINQSYDVFGRDKIELSD